MFAYGAATAITFARVRGEKHFPADAFVGSGIGWLTGWQVYRTHHNPELAAASPRTFPIHLWYITSARQHRWDLPTFRSIVGSIHYSIV